jgi:hypothetical protein
MAKHMECGRKCSYCSKIFLNHTFTFLIYVWPSNNFQRSFSKVESTELKLCHFLNGLKS